MWNKTSICLVLFVCLFEFIIGLFRLKKKQEIKRTKMYSPGKMYIQLWLTEKKWSVEIFNFTIRKRLSHLHLENSMHIKNVHAQRKYSCTAIQRRVHFAYNLAENVCSLKATDKSSHIVSYHFNTCINTLTLTNECTNRKTNRSANKICWLQNIGNRCYRMAYKPILHKA